MQLDLQSVENVPFQYVRMSFGPEKVGNWSCSPQDEPELSPRSIHRFSHFSGGALAVKHRQQFFDPTGSNTITIVHRIDKNDLSRAVSRFSRGSVAGNHRQHLLFQSNWVKYDYSTIVHRIEKTVAWPLEKRDTALDRSWRKLRLILR